MDFRLNLRVLAHALLSAVVLLGLTLAAHARDRLVIANWGGVFGESLDKNVLDSFKKEFNVDVVIHKQAAASDTLAKLKAEKDKPTIDIYFATWGGATTVAREGMAEELTAKDIPELANLFPKLVGKYDGRAYWIGVNPKSRGLAVRRDLVKVPAEVTIKWLANKDLKGRLAVPTLGWGQGAILLALALANGGNESNIEPGFAFAKLVAPNINVIYRTTGETVRLLTTGEAAVSYVNSNAAATLVASGLDIGFYAPKDTPLYLDSDAVLVVKGGPGGREVAMKFMKYFTHPDRLNAYCWGTGSSSPHTKAPAPPKDKVPFPFDASQMAAAFFPDGKVADTIDKSFDSWDERWKREIIPIIGK